MWDGDTPAGPLIHIVAVMSSILLILAAISTIFTTWATVIDAERPTAIARALGTTPREITGGLATAQLIAGFAAALIGIPAGAFLFAAAGGNSMAENTSPRSLLAVIPGTLIAVAIVTAAPAWIGAHRGIAQILQSE
jgi:putative ABC transport system permease protein